MSSPSLHKELRFEDELCEHLAASGWTYTPKVSAQYDRARALFPEDVLAWVQQTQLKAWDALYKAFGARAEESCSTACETNSARAGRSMFSATALNSTPSGARLRSRSSVQRAA